MNVKVSKEQIFWNSNTDNKPSQSYLDQLESRCTSTNININYLDYYHINVVLPDRSTTYLIVDDNGFKKYFFFYAIEKRLNNGYVMTFELDIFSTFTLKYFDSLANKTVKLNRSHKFNHSALFYSDNMLDLVPLVYDGFVDSKHSSVTVSRIVGQNSWKISFQGLIVEYQTANNNAPNGVPGNKYYVFRDLTADGYLMFIPVLYDTKSTSNISALYATTRAPNKAHARTQILNSEQELEFFRKAPDLSNKFLGIFTLPNFFNFRNSPHKYQIIDYKYEIELPDVRYDLPPQKQEINGSVIVLTVKPDGEKINYPIFVSGDSFGQEIDIYQYSEQIPTLNTTKPHQFILDYFDYEIWNNKLKVSLLYNHTHKNILIENWIFLFAQSGVVKYFGNTNNDIIPYDQGIINLPNELPIWIDNYLNYVNANKNSRDNQLHVWKQQLALGLIGDVVGSTNVISSALSLGNSVVGYSQKLNSMKAQYADAKNTMGYSLQAGNVIDAVIGKIYNYNTNFGPGEYFVRHKNLTDSTIKALNNILYFYGRYEPQIGLLSSFKVRADFNYYLFDKEYLSLIFTSTIQTNIPVELHNHIMTQLSEGVRIWEVAPNYA